MESNYFLPPPKNVIITVNPFRYINNNFTKICVPYLWIWLWSYKFILQATIDHQGPSMYSGHHTTSTVAKNILWQFQQNYGVWQDWYQNIAHVAIFKLIIKCFFKPEQEDGSVITPTAMAHPTDPIWSRSRNKRRNLWVGWRVSSWWPRFWSVYSIHYYIHTMNYSCILSIWNKLFLRHIPRVGVAMTVCWMIWYCYSFLRGFKCIFQLCQDFLYHNVYISTMWHCAVVSCIPSQSTGLFLGVRCFGVECHYVFLLLIINW